MQESKNLDLRIGDLIDQTIPLDEDLSDRRSAELGDDPTALGHRLQGRSGIERLGENSLRSL